MGNRYESQFQKKKKKKSRRASSVILVNKQRIGLRVTHDIDPSCGKESFTSFLFWSLNIYFFPMYMNSRYLSRLSESLKCSIGQQAA